MRGATKKNIPHACHHTHKSNPCLYTFNPLTTYMVHDKTPVKELPDPLKKQSIKDQSKAGLVMVLQLKINLEILDVEQQGNCFIFKGGMLELMYNRLA